MNNEEQNLKPTIASKIKNAALKIVSVFREFPVTLGCIVIIAAISAVIVDCDFDTEICERVMLALAALSVQALFIEEHMRGRLGLRIAGYVVAALLAAFCQYAAFYKGELFLGMEFGKAMEILAKLYGTYFTCLGLASLYHMYRRQGDTFESFFLKTFFGLVRTSVVYGLFAAGLAVIILIFDALIFHTHSFLGRAEIFLAGGIYVPAMLLVVSGKKGGVGKFAKACVLYVLDPLLILAMAIIYLYIVKIFVANAIPKNVVFSIITALFAAGMVIWTLACGIGEDNIFCKIARALPFVFIPCIVLQAWSVLIRIGDYGFTPSRYFGVALVVFEMIYMLLYLIQRLFKKEAIALIMWVGCICILTTLILPYTNYAAICVRSQVQRLDGIKVNEQLIGTELGEMAGSAYDVLANDCGYRGREIIDSMYTIEEQKILNESRNGADYTSRTEYFGGKADIVDLDISGYKTLSSVEGKAVGPDIQIVELSIDGEAKSEADISKFAADLVDFASTCSDSTMYDAFDLSAYAPIALDEHSDLKLTWFNAEYDTESKTLEYINFEGYLLGK